MKGALPVLLLFAVALAGCVAPESANANLLAPKLVADFTWKGDVQVFIHSVFGERLYDRIDLTVDNATVEERNATYSLETRLNVTRFYVEANAEAGSKRFAFQGAFNFSGFPSDPRVRVSILNEDAWGEPRACALPCEVFLSQAVSTDENA